jgi:hypothetical protein
MRLVERCKGNISLEVRQNASVNKNRLAIHRTAMNNAMTDRNQINFLRFAKPFCRQANSSRNIWNVSRCIFAVDLRLTIRAGYAQSRPTANSFNLAPDRTYEVLVRADSEHLKLQARRTGIND